MDPWPEQNTNQGMYPTSDVTNHIEVRGAFFLVVYCDCDVLPVRRIHLADLEKEAGIPPLKSQVTSPHFILISSLIKSSRQMANMHAR